MKSPVFLLKMILIALTLYGMTKLLRRNNTPVTQSATLIVGTNTEYPPYSFIENNAIVGYDIDIIKEVARRLGKIIELQDMSFTALLPQLQAGRIHVIAAGMTKTEERAKHVLFSIPHFSNDPLIAITRASDGPITNVDDLMNKNVVVNEGFTADTFVSSLNVPNITRLAAVADAFMSLSSGRADVFVTALSAAKNYLETQEGSFAMYTIPNSTEEYVLTISQKYPELQQEIDRVLNEMKEDGALRDLQKKWGLA